MKNLFDDDIEVPFTEIDEVIEKGIQKGERTNKRRSVKHLRFFNAVKITTIATASFMIVFSLGFVSEPIAHAMSSLPIIGETLESFYASYDSRGGSVENLPEQSQIQVQGDELIVSDRGIDCQMLGAYNYHNGTIGVFFQFSGFGVNERVLVNGYDSIREYEYDVRKFEFYVGDFVNDPNLPYTSARAFCEEVDGTYVCCLEISFEDEYAENLETLPITFTYLGGRQGEWHFEVPIEEDLNYTDLGGEAYSNGAVTAQFESLYQEEGITKIYCSVTIDNNGQILSDDKISITFTDSQGQELPVKEQELTDYVNESNPDVLTYTYEIELGSPIPDGCKYIIACVEVTLDTGEVITLEPIQLDL